MKKLLLLLLMVPFSLILANGITEKSEIKNSSAFNPFNPASQKSKVYYGGSVGLRFWNDYFYLGVYPMIGYKITPEFSIGGKIGYAYIRDNHYDPIFSSNNYGGSIFMRYQIVPQLYAQTEFVYFSYENITSYNVTTSTFKVNRAWVPFLLLGGGYTQMISEDVIVFAEVLFDVINDPNSPYAPGDPFVSLGAEFGF